MCSLVCFCVSVVDDAQCKQFISFTVKSKVNASTSASQETQPLKGKRTFLIAISLSLEHDI